eukprot:GDKK01025185.1.p1 GENE.GDKK01025185.1~~GDKK01025185.1.p1  ORF type:complete len:602 (+),score=165.97 GDKK01025185.1:36-1841(+)
MGSEIEDGLKQLLHENNVFPVTVSNVSQIFHVATIGAIKLLTREYASNPSLYKATFTCYTGDDRRNPQIALIPDDHLSSFVESFKPFKIHVYSLVNAKAPSCTDIHILGRPEVLNASSSSQDDTSMRIQKFIASGVAAPLYPMTTLDTASAPTRSLQEAAPSMSPAIPSPVSLISARTFSSVIKEAPTKSEPASESKASISSFFKPGGSTSSTSTPSANIASVIKPTTNKLAGGLQSFFSKKEENSASSKENHAAVAKSTAVDTVRAPTIKTNPVKVPPATSKNVKKNSHNGLDVIEEEEDEEEEEMVWPVPGEVRIKANDFEDDFLNEIAGYTGGEVEVEKQVEQARKKKEETDSANLIHQKQLFEGEGTEDVPMNGGVGDAQQKEDHVASKRVIRAGVSANDGAVSSDDEGIPCRKKAKRGGRLSKTAKALLASDSEDGEDAAKEKSEKTRTHQQAMRERMKEIQREMDNGGSTMRDFLVVDAPCSSSTSNGGTRLIDSIGRIGKKRVVVERRMVDEDGYEMIVKEDTWVTDDEQEDEKTKQKEEKKRTGLEAFVTTVNGKGVRSNNGKGDEEDEEAGTNGKIAKPKQKSIASFFSVKK